MSKRKGKGGCGCWIFVLLQVGFVGLIILAVWKLGPQPPETIPVPGDAAHFDPVASFDPVAKFAGPGAMFMSMQINYVRADGTLDLTTEAYRPGVTYEFVLPLSEPPTNAPPVGAGGSISGDWYEPIDVELSRPGQWYTITSGSGEVSYMNQGMERDVNTAVNEPPHELTDPPRCSMAKLWDTAIAQDAPRDAVAIVRYDASGYSFSISDMDIYLNFDSACQLVN